MLDALWLDSKGDFFLFRLPPFLVARQSWGRFWRQYADYECTKPAFVKEGSTSH